MKEKIFSVSKPIRRILHSEPAAVIGSLMTAHREHNGFVIGVKGTMDGSIIGTTFLEYLSGRNPDLKILAFCLLLTRIVFTGSVYLDKIRSRHI